MKSSHAELKQNNSNNLNGLNESKTPQEVQKKLSLTQVIELIDTKLPNDHCSLTLSVPIIPFAAKFNNTNSQNSRFSDHSYELGALLTYLIAHENNTNPFTKKPLSIQDINTEIFPNFKLIESVDAILKEHHFTRTDLLNHYGITPELYDYLLNLKYESPSFLRKPLTHFLLGFLCTYLFDRIFRSYSCEANLRTYQHAYSVTANNDIYTETTTTFHEMMRTIIQPLGCDLKDVYGIVNVPKALRTIDLARSSSRYADTIGILYGVATYAIANQNHVRSSFLYSLFRYGFLIYLLLLGLEAITGNFELINEYSVAMLNMHSELFLNEFFGFSYEEYGPHQQGIDVACYNNVIITDEYGRGEILNYSPTSIKQPSCSTELSLSTSGIITMTMAAVPLILSVNSIFSFFFSKKKNNKVPNEFKQMEEKKDYDYFSNPKSSH